MTIIATKAIQIDSHDSCWGTNPPAAEDPKFTLASSASTFNGKSAVWLHTGWGCRRCIEGIKHVLRQHRAADPLRRKLALYTFAMGEYGEPDGSAAAPAKSAAQQILELFEAGDRVLIGTDVAELRRIYADDYIQYDERGRAVRKQDVVDNLESRRIRFVSMESRGAASAF